MVINLTSLPGIDQALQNFQRNVALSQQSASQFNNTVNPLIGLPSNFFMSPLGQVNPFQATAPILMPGGLVVNNQAGALNFTGGFQATPAPAVQPQQQGPVIVVNNPDDLEEVLEELEEAREDQEEDDDNEERRPGRARGLAGGLPPGLERLLDRGRQLPEPFSLFNREDDD